jgi:hypothetical protein
MLNRENSPYIRTIIKQWLCKQKIKHTAFEGGFIIELPEGTISVSFITPENQKQEIYCRVKHYPWKGICVEFPCSTIARFKEKLQKFKFINQ